MSEMRRRWRNDVNEVKYWFNEVLLWWNFSWRKIWFFMEFSRKFLILLNDLYRIVWLPVVIAGWHYDNPHVWLHHILRQSGAWHFPERQRHLRHCQLHQRGTQLRLSKSRQWDSDIRWEPRPTLHVLHQPSQSHHRPLRGTHPYENFLFFPKNIIGIRKK